MNWLSRLDEIVTNLLPDEDRPDAKLLRRHNATPVTMDPLLEMDLNYGAEEDDEAVEGNYVDTQTTEQGSDVSLASAESTVTVSLSESMEPSASTSDPIVQGSQEVPVEGLFGDPSRLTTPSTAIALQPDRTSYFLTPESSSYPELHPQNLQGNETPYFRTPETFRSPPFGTETQTTSATMDSDLSPTETASHSRSAPTGTTAELRVALPPRNINIMEQDMADVDLVFPLPDWKSTEVVFHPSMNCLGVVHVRALAAQRLPCPVGSTVQMAVSLLPWNGKVRGEPAVTFRQNSVCVKWDALNEATGCSMVHSWNSHDTPVPTIKMELLFKPMRVLEFTMCSLDLSCEPLLAQPGVWKKQWCQTTLSLQAYQDLSVADHIPLVLVEAAFFPASYQDDDETEKDGEISVFENATSEPPSIRHDDGSSLKSSYYLKAKSKTHLLKLLSLWMPANCAVCKRSVVGWKRAYRCEACSIDCCSDCQLQIDLQIPCGSALAKNAVQSSLQKKMTVENMIATMAPVDETYGKRSWEQAEDSKELLTEYDKRLATQTRRIGKFRIQVHQAYVFETPLPMETEPSTVFDNSRRTKLRRGDYYARVSCLGSSTFNRTRTIQNTGKPKFDAAEMVFDLPHYGMEYRVDVFDAYSNITVGTVLVTAQSLLQYERDRRIDRDGIEPFVPRVRKDRKCESIRLNVELRTGFKEGFGSDYFVPYKTRNVNRIGPKPGAISGWITVDMSIDEDIDALFGPSPLNCTARPPNNLDMELLQNHIRRITVIVEDIKSVIRLYLYVVSWKNPALTILSLVVFLRFCFKVDTEYIGSLPILILILMMLYLAAARKAGRLKDRFIQKEFESRASPEIESSVDRSLHRPLGFIQLSVPKGRNLWSRDLGLPGSVGCHVFWHPHRYCVNKEAAMVLSSTDKLLMSHHDVGDTNYVYTANPEWEILKESNDCMRLHEIIPPETGAGQTGERDRNDDYVEFPVLQPIQDRADNADGANSPQIAISLSPWTTLPGAIVVQVRFADVINMLPGFEDVLGEVAIPVSNIIQKGGYRGWFQVVEAGSKHFVRCDENDGAGTPRIFVDVKWKEPVSTDYHVPDAAREASIMVAEEMLRAAVRNSRRRLNFIGSSMGALNTVRGLGETIQSIQNTLGNAVDVVERVRNLFNFTDPGLSSFVLFVLSFIWVFLSLTPTRALVFLAGIVQYCGTFFARFGPALIGSCLPDNPKESRHGSGDKQAAAPLAIWLANAFDSIPTDDDLRKAYFWESVRMSDIEYSKLATLRRVSRLEQLWNAKWYSTLKIRVAEGSKGRVSSRLWSWGSRFGVVHGRRLLIWSSESDFDAGEPPMDRVVLSGHAGLGGLSPLEIRELSSEEISRVVIIFGRGIHGQLKLMLLLPNESVKGTLEETVLDAALKDD